MGNDFNLDQVLHTFILEARELLEDMEAALLRVADEADPRESINAIFRAAHTIKGSSGLFGLDAIVAFTHVVESVLDRVRDETVALDEPLMALMLACGDYIGRLVDAVERGEPQGDPEAKPEGAALLERLQKYLGTPAAHAAPAPAVASASAAAPGSPGHWHLSLRFGPDVLRNGMDPLAFIRYLATLGEIEHIVMLPDAVPPSTRSIPKAAASASRSRSAPASTRRRSRTCSSS